VVGDVENTASILPKWILQNVILLESFFQAVAFFVPLLSSLGIHLEQGIFLLSISLLATIEGHMYLNFTKVRIGMNCLHSPLTLYMTLRAITFGVPFIIMMTTNIT
jgi:hypothetical protein